MKILAYHGTDLSAANKILTEPFMCKPNKYHWLGNGIYLYMDKSLAKWWTSKPSKRFGTTIETPAIIECEIEVDDDKVLNLCELSGYQNYINEFNKFFKEDFYKHRPNSEIDFGVLRSLFFNFIFELEQVDIIIAPFLVPDQPYLPQYCSLEHGNKMHIMYTEVQICIRQDKQQMIKQKRIIGGTSNE